MMVFKKVGCQIRANAGETSTKCFIGFHELVEYTMITPSSLALARYRASGEKAMAVMVAECPGRVVSSMYL
jgi:hypothetical protein